jgi:hypothetical protein
MERSDIASGRRFGDFDNVPVLPPVKAQVDDMGGLEAPPMSNLRELHRNVFIDEKARRIQAPRLSMMRVESGRLFLQDGFRGRPRRGCDFA